MELVLVHFPSSKRVNILGLMWAVRQEIERSWRVLAQMFLLRAAVPVPSLVCLGGGGGVTGTANVTFGRHGR